MRQPLGVRAALERAVPAADGGQVPVALGLGTGCGAITALAAMWRVSSVMSAVGTITDAVIGW